VTTGRSSRSDTFLKSASGVPGNFYPAEAAGLAWLAAAGPGSARVVRVLDVTAHAITLERLHPDTPTNRAAEALGHALVRTHAAGASAFGQGPDGWSGDGYLGQQELTLRPSPSWGVFFAEQRLLPYATKAHRLGRLGPEGLRTVERVCARLTVGDFDDGLPPARIHGDLWAGNVVFTHDEAVLIDPAAHGGHPLTDLAMLHLFGAPRLGAITAAYVESAGWSDGWQDLVELHQLHPLLVHAASHGAAYGQQAAAVARRYS
jgi:fructosamine-3-kinase